MSKETIAIIDYGSGNIRSAEKAVSHVVKTNALNATILITNKPEDIAKADRIILPGQGAFRDCMDNLKATDGMIEALEQRVLKDAAPFLGICVGMQLLAKKGLEHGEHDGLNWIEGQITPLSAHINDKSLKIPHMGWNTVQSPQNDNPHFVLRSTENSEITSPHYYFVHSFMFECMDKNHVLGTCNYGGDFAAIVGRDNIIGVQFHPEKSQDTGLALIHNFLSWKP